MSALAARPGAGRAGLMATVLAGLIDRERATTVANLAKELGEPCHGVAFCVAQLLQAHILERGEGYDEVRMSRFGRELRAGAVGSLASGCHEPHPA